MIKIFIMRFVADLVRFKGNVIYPDEIIALIEDNTVTIISQRLFQMFRLNGIIIPDGLKDAFSGKRVIYYHDSLFCKAFVEIYYPTYLAKSYKMIQREINT